MVPIIAVRVLQGVLASHVDLLDLRMVIGSLVLI